MQRQDGGNLARSGSSFHASPFSGPVLLWNESGLNMIVIPEQLSEARARTGRGEEVYPDKELSLDFSSCTSVRTGTADYGTSFGFMPILCTKNPHT